MALAPLAGLRAVPFRRSTDALVCVGLVLLLVGWFWPWLGEGDYCNRPRFREVTWILEHAHYDVLLRSDDRAPIEWWWSLPLAYGLALPALWCRRYRDRTGVRLVAGWGCLVVVLGVLAWAFASAPFDWDSIRWEARYCPQRSFAWALQPLQPSEGFYFTAVGALLVGLGPVVELQRLRRVLARWHARRGRAVASRRDDEHAPSRLPYSLRRLVKDARELRVHLSPFEPLDGVPEHMLVEIVGRLRSLDDEGLAALRDHGLSASVLLESLAPAEPRHESSMDEALRLDAALAKLEALGLAEDGPAPYR